MWILLTAQCAVSAVAAVASDASAQPEPWVWKGGSTNQERMRAAVKLQDDAEAMEPSEWQVVGFHTAKGDAEYNSSAQAWRSYDWASLTALVNYGNVADPQMVQRARAANVTVLGNGCPACPRGWTRTTQLLNATVRAQVVSAMVQFAAENQLHGLNLDIEGNPAGTAGAVTSFVCELRTAMRAKLGPGSKLAFDGPALPTCYHSKACNRSIPDVEDYSLRYDFKAIDKCVDWYLPMDYDLTGSAPDGKAAAANSPLAVVTETVAEYTALGVAPSKLRLLLPWYGYDMTCAPGSQSPACMVQLPWAMNNHEVGFASAWRRRQALSDKMFGRDADGSPWYDYTNSTSWRHRVYYDDAVSIARKVAMAHAHGIGGIGLWTADTMESLRMEPAAKNEIAAMWGALWPARSATAKLNDETIELRRRARNVRIKLDDESPPRPGDAYSPFGVDKTVYDLVLAKLKARHDAITALGNDTAKWKLRQAEVRASLGQLFAPLPPTNRTKTPSFVDRGNTTGEGFTLRKLLVETRPGYYASAGLFTPVKTDGRPIPAILFPSGHSTLTWREPGNQLIAMNLAKRGIAVLGYDPIGQGERRMMPDLDGRGGTPLNGTESFGCSMEHEYVQRVSSLNGLNAASSWVWDMTILVDFLEALPGIDETRLGVAGCSGGGVQSAYIGSIDERLVAASIACYTSILTVDYAPSTGLPFIGGGGPAEGEQQWGPLVATGTMLDKPDLLTIRAPRATQVLLTTRDQYFPLGGGQAAVAEASPAFSALSPAGAQTNLTMTVGNNSHGYINKTRSALYTFFSKHLLHKADSGAERQCTSFLTFEDMRVTSTGDVITARELNDGKGSATIHEAFIMPATLANLAQLEQKRADAASFLSEVESTAAEVIGFNLSAGAPTMTQLANGTNSTLRFAVDGEGRCKVGLEVLPAAPATAKKTREREAVLYVSRKGQALSRPRPGMLSEVEQTRVAAIQAAGFAVVLVDVCGFGTLADRSGDAYGLFDLPSRAYRTKESHPVDAMYNVGRSLVGLHAADVTRAALAVTSMKMQVVATLAANETAPAVLAAAVIAAAQPQPRAMLGQIGLISNVASWAHIAQSPRYDMSSYYSFVFGILRHFDAPDMVAALNASVLVAQPLDAERNPLTASAADSAFAFAKKQKLAGVGLLAGADVGPSEITQALLKWLPTKSDDGSSAQYRSSGAGNCSSSLDCCGSTCVGGQCKCDLPGFEGPSCCKLALGDCSVAVHPNETWTWGAAPRWAAGGGVEVLAMSLRNQCGINNYRYNADILRATSSSPFHPFAVHDKFEPGAPPRFDATEVEDPNVVELPDGSGTLLFYTGAWVKGDVALNCSDGDKLQPDSGPLANAQRIGVAYRKQGETKWQRSASPILSTREGKWDSTRVSNPAGVVFPNGTTVLAYRGNGNTGHGGIGVATAPHWSGPYTHLYESPLFSGYAEDPTLFLDKNGVVHMVAHGELPPQP